MLDKHYKSSIGSKEKAVVLVLSPTGLSIARSLAPKGVDVYGVDSLKLEIGHFSKWIKHDKRISYYPPGPKLLEGLLEFGKEQNHAPVLFVAGDTYIEFVVNNWAPLQKYYVLADSMCSDLNRIILNKKTFYERCRSLGVAMPTTYFPENENDAINASLKLRYPAIVKPTIGHLLRSNLKGQKLIEVSNSKNLIYWWRRFREWGSDSVLQEVVEGSESNIYVAGLYTDRNLNCRSLFTARKIRQYPPMYGSGSYMESYWSPEIAESSIDLVRRLEYQGICGTEYKWDQRDNTWKLIEVNCRPTLWFALTRASGVDIVWDAYCDLRGRPNPVNIGRQQNGVRWQYLVRDMLSGVNALRRGDLRIRDFIHTVLDPRKKEYAILSSSDMPTALAYPINILSKYWIHFLRKK